jgi:hypothetical protein
MATLQGKLSIDLAAGFEWHAVLVISAAQSSDARKVFFEAGPPAGGPKFTVALDLQDNLFLAVTDVDGKEHATPSVPREHLAGPLHIGCVVRPTETGNTQLLLSVNDEVRAQTEFRANVGGATEVTSSMGTDVGREHPAAFSVSEVLAYGKVLSPTERVQLQAYLKGRYPSIG